MLRTRSRKCQFVYLAGPLVSISLAVLLYILLLVSHIPLLNFGAVLNLGLATASLLAVPPLEGAVIGEGYYTRWIFWVAIFVTVMSALIAANSFVDIGDLLIAACLHVVGLGFPR